MEVKKKYFNVYQGLNSRLDEMQAAFLDIKLKYIDNENQQRRQLASIYLNEINNKDFILPFSSNNTLKVENNREHVWHLFVIRHSRRNQLQDYLIKKGIETLIHYPIPSNKQLAYKEMNELNFPITNSIHNEVLSLPISSVMTLKEVETVIKVVNGFN